MNFKQFIDFCYAHGITDEMTIAYIDFKEAPNYIVIMPEEDGAPSFYIS